MATFEYTASRSLMTGISPGDIITLMTPLVSALPNNDKNETVRKALSGRRRKRVMNRTETLAITSPVVPVAAMPVWEQFVNSIDDGQTFTVDSITYELDGTWQKELVSKEHLSWRFIFTLYRVRT